MAAINDRRSQFVMWMKWRWFLFGNGLASLFRFSRHALSDIQSNILPDSATGYEGTKASKFYEFFAGAIDTAIFALQDIYFIVLVLSAAGLLARFAFPFGPISDFYILVVAAGAGTLALVGFIFAAITRVGRRIPVRREEYERSKRLLHLLGEANRRPPPFGVKLLMFVMLLVDAAMISVVVLDYTADLPRYWSLAGGGALGLILAFLLHVFNNRSGEALFREHHRQELLWTIGDEKKRTEQGESPTEQLIKEHVLLFNVRQRSFSQRFGSLIITCVLIALICVLGAYARYNINNNIILDQVKAAAIELNMESSNELLPREVTNQQMLSGSNIGAEEQRLAQRAMLAAITVLAIIFLMIQIAVMMMSYRYCFYLRNGEDQHAYESIRQYETDQLINAESGEMMTHSQQTVVKTADTFFAGYFTKLLDVCEEQNQVNTSKKLQARGPYRFINYVQRERETFESEKETWKPTTPGGAGKPLPAT